MGPNAVLVKQFQALLSQTLVSQLLLGPIHSTHLRASSSLPPTAQRLRKQKLPWPLCVGKNNCTVSTDELRNSVGDPCSGHHKRLAVVATGCVAVQLPPTRPKIMFTS